MPHDQAMVRIIQRIVWSLSAAHRKPIKLIYFRLINERFCLLSFVALS